MKTNMAGWGIAKQNFSTSVTHFINIPIDAILDTAGDKGGSF